ncbi:unnamed protein product [Arctogadus glacialis]
MPVFFSPGPQTLRAGLSYVGSAVFANNRTTDSDVAQEQDDRSAVHELVSHLPLQMLLYFNMFYFPCWWASAVAMLHLKLCLLPGVLLPGPAGHRVILLTAIEAATASTWAGWGTSPSNRRNSSSPHPQVLHGPGRDVSGVPNPPGSAPARPDAPPAPRPNTPDPGKKTTPTSHPHTPHPHHRPPSTAAPHP